MPTVAVRMRPAVIVCALALLGCAAVPRESGNAKLALVIGNGGYRNAPTLTNPLNDAADMCEALRRVGFRTLCHTNLRDRAEFETRIAEYVAQLGPKSIGVVYYSGHGVQVGNANFLIPTEVQLKTVSEDPVRVLYAVDDLFDRLRAKPTKLEFVILDACRTDLLAAAPRELSARGLGPAPGSNLLRSLKSVAHARNGLAPIKDAPPSTMVLYATASNSEAFDGEGRNGPLTKHILQHIGTKGLPLGEFITRVMSGVENETLRDYHKRQTPFIYGSFTGKFCFAGCPGDGIVPPAM